MGGKYPLPPPGLVQAPGGVDPTFHSKDDMGLATGQSERFIPLVVATGYTIQKVHSAIETMRFLLGMRQVHNKDLTLGACKPGAARGHHMER